MSYQQHLESITQIGREYRHDKSVEYLFELDQRSASPPQGRAYSQELAAYTAREKKRLYCTDQAARAEETFSQGSLRGV